MNSIVFLSNALRRGGVLLLCILSFAFNPAIAECLRDNADGTLTDPQTGLIWQTCALGQNWDGKLCAGEARKFTWSEALEAANADRFQNKSDWILPTKEQFEGVLSANCNHWNGIFWSASPYVGTRSAWYVVFNKSVVSGSSRDYGYYVGLVRASQLSEIETFKSSLAALNAEKMATLEEEKLERARIIEKEKLEHARIAEKQKLEPQLAKAEDSLKCEEAQKIKQKLAAINESSSFDFDSCVSTRTFNNLLTLKDPQKLYLSAVKYENNGERGRAKRVYLTIMERFERHPMAIKAADRLASLSDVEAVESSNRNAASRAETASRQAAQAQRESDRNASNRASCFSGVNSCVASCRSSGMSYDSIQFCVSRCQRSCN